MTDKANIPQELTAPSPLFATVTPSDSVPQYWRVLHVDVAGDVAVVGRDDSTNTAVTFHNLPVGYILRTQTKYVMATNTTASLIGLK